MNVTVSVLGRFHAFYLARELERRGYLERLVTSYPAWGAARWGVPRDRVTSLWPLEAARRAVPQWARGALQRRGVIQAAYDSLASKRLPSEPEIVVAWSGAADRTLERGRAAGAITIVERCSSHIRVQREILQAEYERHGIRPELPSLRTVEREEREYERADRIAVPSSFVRSTFLEEGVRPEKLLVVPYGVDPVEFEPVPREDRVFRVVFAGGIGVRKGVRYLLDAFERADLPNAELLLLGEVTEEAESWLASPRPGVRHPGHVPQRELRQWYSQGSVFVHPSLEEGMAYVQLQAMACGLPLVCTPRTGGDDLIRDGREGFVVPAGNVEALRERLIWCYEHQDELQDMGQAARRRVLQNFTWEHYGNRVVAAYRNLLHGGGG